MSDDERRTNERTSSCVVNGDRGGENDREKWAERWRRWRRRRRGGGSSARQRETTERTTNEQRTHRHKPRDGPMASDGKETMEEAEREADGRHRNISRRDANQGSERMKRREGAGCVLDEHYIEDRDHGRQYNVYIEALTVEGVDRLDRIQWFTDALMISIYRMIVNLHRF